MSVYYQEVLGQVQQLNPAEQLRLLEELVGFIRRKSVQKQPHSLMELQGLGKSIWQGVDVEKYVERERDSWNG